MYIIDVDTILKEKGKTRYWLFNQMNSRKIISYSNFLNIIDNRTSSIKLEKLEQICEIIECTPNDIIVKVKAENKN